MRVYLTAPELETVAGKELLKLCQRISIDGKLDLEEIKELRRWLHANQTNTEIAAVPYLCDIMVRIIADKVIDRDELIELHLAIERVIPASHRTAAVQARKTRESDRRDQQREQLRQEQEREKEGRRLARQEELARANRIRHAFSNVAGVTFPNDDGTYRQNILARCKPGEWLELKRDKYNRFSSYATKVLRRNGEQLGHVPEYLAERVCAEIESGRLATGILTEVTGGTFDRPTMGANIAIFFADPEVDTEELGAYAKGVV